jgi:Holliday junction resolvase
MKHSNLKRKIVETLKKNFKGAFIWTPYDRINIGLPDIMMFYRGVLVAIEIKSSEKKLRKSQIRVKELIENNKGLYYEVYAN